MTMRLKLATSERSPFEISISSKPPQMKTNSSCIRFIGPIIGKWLKCFATFRFDWWNIFYFIIKAAIPLNGTTKSRAICWNDIWSIWKNASKAAANRKKTSRFIQIIFVYSYSWNLMRFYYKNQYFFFLIYKNRTAHIISIFNFCFLSYWNVYLFFDSINIYNM